MSFDRCSRFKDPFSISPLPKSFYHPTPVKDVDVNVAIQSSERKAQPTKKSEFEKQFKAGSTFQLAALPQLKQAIPKTVNTLDHVINSRESYDETWPGSEQPSNSNNFMNASQLTSSIEDKEVDLYGNIPHQENKVQNSDVQNAPESVLQKYINRFRYSAPKSREERKKEKSEKTGAFWWMNSDVPFPNVTKTDRKELEKSNLECPTQLNDGMKLTKEAVLKLDKETSALQQKADMLLSKSQLSLASSGPCVSTDGLGSSSGLSEYSYKTDPQPAYRPIFINLQEGHESQQPKHFQIEEKASSPNDVLTQWRMRKKIGNAHHSNVQIPTKQRPVKSHSEIDIRLEEFRKKLIAQRALITSEDIKFERQKMKMLIDEDEEKQQKKIVEQQDEKELPTRVLPNEDIVLARLRKITRKDEPPSVGNSSSTNNYQTEISDIAGTLPLNHGKEEKSRDSNSNNVNIKQRESDSVIRSSFSDQCTLNTNNKGSNNEELDRQMHNGQYCVDEMKSLIICDPKQNAFVLKDDSDLLHDDKGGLIRNNDAFKCIPEKSGKRFESDRQSQNSNKENNYILKENYVHNVECDKAQKVPYHQRLQAEKPCDDDSEDKSDHGQCKKEEKILKSNENEFNQSELRKREKHNQKRQRGKHKTKSRENSSLSEGSNDDCSESSENTNLVSKSKRHHLQKTEAQETITASQTKPKPFHAETESATKARKQSPVVEKGKMSPCVSRSRSSQQNTIHKVIGDTVVDHLFDGPSMISSVDSWASLFPHSPAHSHSMHNSTSVTPTKDISSCDQITSTPHGAHVSFRQGNNSSNEESSEEFSHDPLMCLLLQQKQDYIKKLELIEVKLQQLEDS